MEDYYKVLGVAYDDPPEKIKARYRLLALTVHPDVGGVGRTMEFTRYSQAYRVLSRQSERERYNVPCSLAQTSISASQFRLLKQKVAQPFRYRFFDMSRAHYAGYQAATDVTIRA